MGQAAGSLGWPAAGVAMAGPAGWPPAPGAGHAVGARPRALAWCRGGACPQARPCSRPCLGS
eukprot:14826313-Heterocapsa_arctica.AAC.1